MFIVIDCVETLSLIQTHTQPHASRSVIHVSHLHVHHVGLYIFLYLAIFRNYRNYTVYTLDIQCTHTHTRQKNTDQS